jgi:phosphate acetyltransferase/phosphate butyryltransferase
MATPPLTTFIENRTFDEIQVGDSASIVQTLTTKDIDLFAVMSGDVNPAHVDEEFARSDMFREVIAHGMWGGALISTVLGTKLPGPGAIYLGQTLRFRHPVRLGDTVTVEVKVVQRDAEKRRVTFDCQCINQKGEVVITGNAEVLAPTEKIKRPRVVLPQVYMVDPEEQYKRFLKMAEGLEPVRTAVVHPVDRASLMSALDAAQANLIVPVLVGPEHKIRAVAEEEDIDLGPCTIVATEHSHAAAAQAVALARAGEVEALMKGKIPTDELMAAAVARDVGIRSMRRMSHVSVVAVPSYPRPLFITDAALNICPDLAAKVDIVQNAIELAHAVGIELPKVAILAAIETVNSKMPATLEASALAKMAERGQIKGGLVDGPLAFDNAVSMEAARIKDIHSPVAGQADILVVPDLEAGNMLAKQLDYLAGAQSAGIIMGARVPIILTSRADPVMTRMASCALAVVVAHHRRTALL